jgi:cell division protein FtsW
MTPTTQNRSHSGTGRQRRAAPARTKPGSKRGGLRTGSGASRPVRQSGHRRSGSFVVLLVVVIALNLIGLVMVLSASSVIALDQTGSSWFHFQRQGIWFLLALGGLTAATRLDYRRLRDFSGLLLAVAFALLFLVLVPGIGTSVNGARRWIVIGPLSIQPSELAKLAMVVWTASLLSRHAGNIRDIRAGLRPVMLWLFACSALIMLQPNLGTTLIIAFTVFVMMYIIGVPMVPLAICAGAGAGAAGILAMLAPYRRARILAFLDPWDDPLNNGYQTIQSLVGIASGGVGGVGLGNGRAKWGFLPFAHTDFIFSVIGEELGLVGAVMIIIMFVILGIVGIKIAGEAPDRFGTLLAVGITAWLVMQAFVNIGAAIGVLPITGVPLPFLSAGGSSLLINMIAVGIMLNIARQARV